MAFQDGDPGKFQGNQGLSEGKLFFVPRTKEIVLEGNFQGKINFCRSP